MFQATRRRLALWYAAVTAVLLLVFACGFYAYVRATLIERVDDTLAHVVEVVERSRIADESTAGINRAARSPAKTFPVQLNRAQTVADDRIDLEWFDAAGQLQWSTFPEPLYVPLLAQQPEKTVVLPSGYALRQLTEPIVADGHLLGYLRASHPWFEVTIPTRRLIADLTLGSTATLGLVTLVGWFLSGLAIAPVRQSYQQLKRFTADASHELRSPIASLQTNVQVALADPEVSDRERHQWQVVERLAQRLGRLVDDLLFLARQDGGTEQERSTCCALDALLLEAWEEQKPLAAEKAIALEIAIADPPDEVAGDRAYDLWGDEDRLLRLLTNPIANAIRYTPPGGRVEVDLCRTMRGAAAYLHLQVRDNGIGIPAAAIPHLFDRFYRVDRARSRAVAEGTSPRTDGGSGLGLAIVKAIADRYRGQIEVESLEGEGTTLTLWLPLDGSEMCGVPDRV